jgi:hypothetical protein
MAAGDPRGFTMRIVAAFLLIGALTPSASLLAHPSPARSLPPLVERVEVTVTSVAVTVLDGHGNPVRDLSGDDYEVLEAGVQKAITNFYEIEKNLSTIQKIGAPGDSVVAGASPSVASRRERARHGRGQRDEVCQTETTRSR